MPFLKRGNAFSEWLSSDCPDRIVRKMYVPNDLSVIKRARRLVFFMNPAKGFFDWGVTTMARSLLRDQTEQRVDKGKSGHARRL